MHWIIPNKFMAFPGPNTTRNTPEGYRAHIPEDYIDIFKKNNIKLVIRLNKKQYSCERFSKHDINHKDLFFLDGSCPKDDIVNTFFEMCDTVQN